MLDTLHSISRLLDITYNYYDETNSNNHLKHRIKKLKSAIHYSIKKNRVFKTVYKNLNDIERCSMSDDLRKIFNNIIRPILTIFKTKSKENLTKAYFAGKSYNQPIIFSRPATATS